MTSNKLTAIETEITVYDSCMNWLKNAVVARAATGFQFTEGAAWHPHGFFLFSDTPANKIYCLLANGDMEVYLGNSGFNSNNTVELSDQIGSNAIAIDAYENIFICQHGNHAIARLDKQKMLSILISTYNGRPFNSPNDLILHPDGTIYFTDPPYGLAEQVLHPEKFQPVAGIYQYKSGTTSLVGTELKYPNGLFFSADEKYLFVSSNHPDDPGIVRYAIDAYGLPQYDGIFMEQHADGMTRGHDGHIYLATDDGLLVINDKAHKLALIQLPESPSNVCWGGPKYEILMVTARSSIYFITQPH